MADWVSFWDSNPGTFVNGRHARLHYERVAADLVRFVPDHAARVLDFGCGEALAAPRFAQRCACLVLCDAAPSTRQALKARHGDQPRIVVASPEEVAAMAQGSFSLIVVHSVIQYVPRAELPGLLAQWRHLLKKGGSLVVSDVMAPGTRDDASALIRCGLDEGFALQALAGLARGVYRPYWRMCAQLGLSTYTQAEMLACLEEARLPATRVRPNVGYNQSRMAFQAFRLR